MSAFGYRRIVGRMLEREASALPVFRGEFWGLLPRQGRMSCLIFRQADQKGAGHRFQGLGSGHRSARPASMKAFSDFVKKPAMKEPEPSSTNRIASWKTFMFALQGLLGVPNTTAH